MFYLIKETLGRKRCISVNAEDHYDDDDEYDCLVMLPFDEDNITWVKSVRIRCTNAPEKMTNADVYTD